MLKTNKSKQNVTILVLSVMLAIAAIFGVTAAWFVSSASASGTVTTGAVQVELKVGTETFAGGTENANGTITTREKIVAGDTILGAVSFKMLKNTNAQGVYVRIKFDVTGIEAETPATLTVFPTIHKTDGTDDWKLVDDYYYYGSGNTKETLKAVTDENVDHVFCAEVKLANTSNEQNVNAKITITIETVQVKNQGETIAWNNNGGVGA